MAGHAYFCFSLETTITVAIDRFQFSYPLRSETTTEQSISHQSVFGGPAGICAVNYGFSD
jgi:hypothetical protein